jgi:tripartite-type tricarboxylate transporter receptor subunit TctC
MAPPASARFFICAATMAEAGIPGYEVSSWHGLFVPAKTPPEIVKKMSVDTIAAIADPARTSRLHGHGLFPR